VSRHGAEYLREKYPAFADRIDCRRLGVGVAQKPGNPVRGSSRVYTCAYLVPVKRMPLLIRGLAVAQGRGLVVRWSHIGAGDGAHADEVRRLAKQLLAPGT